LSPITKNSSTIGKSNHTLWCGAIVAIGTHKPPTLGTILTFSCTPILMELNKYGNKITCSLLIGESNPTFDSNSSFQPYANLVYKPLWDTWIARSSTCALFGFNPMMLKHKILLITK